MKSVGQQLQEARLAKNWTPELAARETKIKADRVRDLEADDYTHFSSPAYARGFVRTYARSLGLDEYKILRLLDNKLPEDDNASFAPDSGMPYVPEPSQTMHVSSAPRTGLYVVLGLFCAVVIIISFVLLQAYRAGELPRYFASTANSDNSPNATSTNSAPIPDAEAPAHALPVDPNDTTHSVRALPVDTSAADTNAAPAAATNAPAIAAIPAIPADSTPVALSVPTPAPAITAVPAPPIESPPSTDSTPAPAAATPETATPSEPAPAIVAVNSAVPPPPTAPVVPDNAPASNSAPPATVPAVVDAPAASTNAAPVNLPVAPPAVLPITPAPVASAASEPEPAPAAPSESSKASAREKPPLRALPVSASELAADEASSQPPTPTPTTDGNTTMVDLGASAANSSSSTKRLVLTASRDSFIRVTSLDGGRDRVLYASVLRHGQSLSFNGHKFSVDVSIPSAVDIMLDGVNYGPHSDGQSPETFTLESHQP
jgi:cytoskeleton protein RodZ